MAAQGSLGVNVYVVVPTVDVLIVAGLQVPANPLSDVVGSVGAVLFWHSGPIGVNVGVIWVATTTSIVTTSAHWPLFGVNV